MPFNDRIATGTPVGIIAESLLINIIRNHLKSRQVYLIDTNSHHGTHIRKPNELTSRMLKSETPTKLSDGDVVTFGKSVGRNNECVRPVVVGIELLYGPREPRSKSISSGKSIDLTSYTPFKSNSGRFGVYCQPSSSPDNPSSDNSDIEELPSSSPASGPNALPLRLREHCGSQTDSSPIGRTIEAIKKLLPSVPNVACATSHQQGYTPSLDGQQSPGSMFNHADSYEPLYSPRSLSWRRSPRWSQAPSNSAESHEHHTPSSERSSSEPNALEQQEQSRQDPSRSHSPMDLASPSPVISKRQLSPEAICPEEPNVVGAWPSSRSPSPPSLDRSSSPLLAIPIELSDVQVDVVGPSRQKAMSIHSICSEPLSNNSGDDISPAREATTNNAFDNCNVEQTPNVEELHSTVKKLEIEFSKLQAHRRKYKARFNSNVRLVSDKLSNLDKGIADVHAQYMLFADRVDSAVDIDIPDLQAQIEGLREQLDRSPVTTTDGDKPTEPLIERPDVDATIGALHSIVADMRALRERTADQMDTELRLVREARNAALAQIAAHVDLQAQTATSASNPSSLKRKRSNDDDCAFAGIDSDEGIPSSDDALIANCAAPSPSAVACHHPGCNAFLPAAKRARTMAVVAAQTATAVTLGAIVTWSALAFS
ncbi:hypothetical protein H0H93_005659 [Arthromyces matolae]|nr:hypothetical protein H0H93_005659 [Arthromyces matolae]